MSYCGGITLFSILAFCDSVTLSSRLTWHLLYGLVGFLMCMPSSAGIPGELPHLARAVIISTPITKLDSFLLFLKLDFK